MNWKLGTPDASALACSDGSSHSAFGDHSAGRPEMLPDVALVTRPPSSVVRGVGGCDFSRRERCLGNDMRAKYRVAGTERVKSAAVDTLWVPEGGMLIQQKQGKIVWGPMSCHRAT